MSLVSAFAPLNYLGCISATLSTAISDFVSCPALLEVIAADNLYPYWMIGFMGKGYGKSKQPLRAIVFTFLLALAFILIGKFTEAWILISRIYKVINNNIKVISHVTSITFFSQIGYDCLADLGFLPCHFRINEFFNISHQFSQTNRMEAHI